MSTPPSTPPETYEASAGRKTILTFVFLLLLPFLISMPIMIAMRGMRGFWSDAISLSVLAILFTLWMAFLLVNLISAYRTKIAIGDQALALEVPKYRGPIPGLAYTEREIPYGQIGAVEERSEIYRATIVPVLMRTASVVTKDQERISLGYMNERSADPAFPIPEIAAKISERAGVPIKNCGCVYAGGQYRAFFKGPPSWESAPLAAEELENLKQRNNLFRYGLIALLLILVIAGLAADLIKSNFFAGGG